MHLKLTAAAALALAAPLAAWQAAPSGPPGSRNVAAITGGTYRADPGHTLVRWTVDHLGFTPYFGIFGDVTGTLQFDPRRPNAARVEVTIPVAKVTTASAGLTEHLLRPGKDGARPDFFGANPADAKFVSTRVVAQGQRARITGNLTLNGVTRPVTLDAQFYGAGKTPQQMGGKETVGFTATGSIRRSQFGIANAIPMVGDSVTLDIVAAFEK